MKAPNDGDKMFSLEKKVCCNTVSQIDNCRNTTNM